MAFTKDDRRFFKNAFNRLANCQNGGDTNILLEQILEAIINQKDYEIVCITNDDGATVQQGIITFPEGAITLNGVDVTGEYVVITCDDSEDCSETPQGVVSTWG